MNGGFSFVSSGFFGLTQSCVLDGTPWQYSRTNSLKLQAGTPSALTSTRGNTGGNQPAAAKTPSKYQACIIIPDFTKSSVLLLPDCICLKHVFFTYNAL